MKRYILTICVLSLLMTCSAFALSKPDVYIDKYDSYKCLIDWEGVKGASGYKIYKSNKKTSGFKLYKTLNSKKGKIYVKRDSKDTYYTVKAYKGKTTANSRTLKCAKKVNRPLSIGKYIAQELSKGNVKINLDGYNCSDKVVNHHYYEFEQDNPLYTFSYAFGYDYGYLKSNLLYSISTNKKYITMANESKAVLDKVKFTGNEYEKAKKCHNWLLDNCTYINNSNYKYHNPYGVIKEGKALCEGYSHTYKYLCDINGVDCRILTEKNETHSYNAVKIGTQWYIVDCTWDDDWYETFKSVKYKYKYFLKSEKTHGIETLHSEFKCDKNY